jgi:hypothetical protein
MFGYLRKGLLFFFLVIMLSSPTYAQWEKKTSNSPSQDIEQLFNEMREINAKLLAMADQLEKNASPPREGLEGSWETKSEVTMAKIHDSIQEMLEQNNKVLLGKMKEMLNEAPKAETKNKTVIVPDTVSVKPKVTMYTMPAGRVCPPCERWKAVEMPKLLAMGVDVEIVPSSGGSTVPYFIVCKVDGTCLQPMTGYTTATSAESLARLAK